jgi:hypothetical protein
LFRAVGLPRQDVKCACSREGIRDRSQSIYFLGQNHRHLTGAVVTTSTAPTTIAFWFYEIFLPGPPHPYIGLLVFLILPGIFVLGLLLIPIGIWLRRRRLRRGGTLPGAIPPSTSKFPDSPLGRHSQLPDFGTHRIRPEASRGLVGASATALGGSFRISRSGASRRRGSADSIHRLPCDSPRGCPARPLVPKAILPQF